MNRCRSCHDYRHLIQRWRTVARETKLKLRKFAEVDGFPCYEIKSGNDRVNPSVYLSAGIHGDEPAGTESLLAWAVQKKDILTQVSILIYPCLNPWGLVENSRLNQQGKDLNRQWDKKEFHHIVDIIDRTRPHRFALAVNLHEDYDANGIYLYEPPGRRKSDHFATDIISAGKKFLPVDTRKKIEGRWSKEGIIRPSTRSLPKEGLPEAAFLQSKRADRTYVFETPSERGLEQRVDAQIAMITKAFDLLI